MREGSLTPRVLSSLQQCWHQWDHFWQISSYHRVTCCPLVLPDNPPFRAALLGLHCWRDVTAARGNLSGGGAAWPLHFTIVIVG